MSKSNVKSSNALSVKLGKDSDAVNKVGALKNIYAALSGKESKGITVSDVIDEITTVAEKPPTTIETTIQYGSYNILYEGNPVKFNGDITKTAVETGAFKSCTGLTSITIPNSVTSIGEGAFYGCSRLASINIPNGVTSIAGGTFQYCVSLTNITIPESVASIGDRAFYNCTKLANIYFRGTEQQWNAITKGSRWNTDMGSSVSGGTVITYNYTG